MPATSVRCSAPSVHLHLDQLPRALHLLRGEDPRHAQVDLHEVVDRNPLVGGRRRRRRGRGGDRRRCCRASTGARPESGGGAAVLAGRSVMTSCSSSLGQSGSPFVITRSRPALHAASRSSRSSPGRPVFAHPPENLGARRRHHGKQKHRRDPHGLDDVRQHLREPLLLPLPGQRPRLGLGDVLVRRVDQAERGERRLVQRVRLHGGAVAAHDVVGHAGEAARGAGDAGRRPWRYSSVIAARRFTRLPRLFARSTL